MVLVYHPEDEFGYEIFKAFDSLPITCFEQQTWEGRLVAVFPESLYSRIGPG